MNPGSPTPQAGILNQSSHPTPSITTSERKAEAIRRPQPETPYQDQIDKTIAKATIEGKAQNTINAFKHRLRQLSRVADLNNPTDVKNAIGYSKLSNSSKSSFALAYEWFTKANELKWEKPRYKWENHIPIIPTTSQVNKIISASTKRFAMIYTLMTETAIEGEELHQTHRNQFDQTQNIFQVRGLKGHGDNNYHLKTPIADMLKNYLTLNPQDYPFPKPKTMQKMWIRARTRASQNHNDPELLKIPMKNLRNYSGAQVYFKSGNSPIAVMRHLRHKKLETTMHYLQAITLDEDPEYDTQIAYTKEDIIRLNNAGYAKTDTLDDGGHVYRKRK